MNNNPFNMPDKEAADLVAKKADQMIKEQDSIGGIIECQITGMPVGIGETVFDKLDAELRRQLCLLELLKGLRSEMDLQLQTLEDQRIMIILSVWMAKRERNESFWRSSWRNE